FEFLLANMVSRVLQLDNGWNRFATLQPVHEILHAGLDNGFCLHHRRLTRVSSTLHQPTEVVHRIEVDVSQAPYFMFDIARHGKVDHHHGAMAAGTRGALDHAQTQYGQGTGRTGNDDVEISNAVG